MLGATRLSVATTIRFERSHMLRRSKLWVLLFQVCRLSLAAAFLQFSPEVIDRARQQPHKRCHGNKMHYTPLVLNTDKDRPILGVCDSSCMPINTKSINGVLKPSLLWYCDSTVTLPENDLDPELYAHKFPFHARTCFVDHSSNRGLAAQIEFEKVGPEVACTAEY